MSHAEKKAVLLCWLPMCAVSFRFDIACEWSNVGDAVVFIICHVRLLHLFLDVHDHDDSFAPNVGTAMCRAMCHLYFSEPQCGGRKVTTCVSRQCAISIFADVAMITDVVRIYTV